ncbi:hypothetical protein V8E52_006718 [Russula decolorans]
MRRYDIVSGILLILSVIDFALAAPLLVQENHQACVDVVHIPKDVITVLGKRGDEELEKLRQTHMRHRAQRCRGPTMGRRTWCRRQCQTQHCQTHMRRRAQHRWDPTMGQRTWCRRQRRTQHCQQPIRVR